jgi:hypothetical protein
MFKRRATGYITTFSFALVLLMSELFARNIAPALPVDPGKWPRIEIAQKLHQMRGYVNDRKPFEVVFVGSSMMAGGVDPVAFTKRAGLRGYNAGFAGPSMRTITPWTLGIVEPLLQPEVVVVGLQSRELSDNGPKNIRMFRKFLDSPGYRQATSNIALRVAGTLERVSYFLRYRRAFREPTELFGVEGSAALEAAQVRQVVGPLGKRIQDDAPYRNSDKFREDLYRKMLYRFEVGGPEYAALEKLYEKLRERGVHLIVLNMPVTEDYWDAHGSPSDRRTYHRALRRFVNNHEVTFVDAENALPKEVFREPLHIDIQPCRWVGYALADAWDELVGNGKRRYKLVCNEEQRRCSIE